MVGFIKLCLLPDDFTRGDGVATFNRGASFNTAIELEALASSTGFSSGSGAASFVKGFLVTIDLAFEED